MGSVSYREVTSERKCKFTLSLSACVLGVLLAPAFALPAGPAAAPAASPALPSAESSRIMPETDAKKLAKYDISRIGRRDVGKGFNLYSLKREQELGQSIAADLDRSTKFIRDAVVTDYINRLAQRIVANSDAEVPFTIKVIDGGDVPRAYGLPGGFLYVDSALILSADGEAELAAVMAHEIAHIAARHATRALSRKRVSNIVTMVGMMAGPAGVVAEDVGEIAGPLSMKKFSRDSEYEADLLGVEYAYSAGYDPKSLMDALEKLHALEAQRSADLAKIPGFHAASMIPFHRQIARGFSSYPLVQERIQRLESEIPAFLPNRKDYIIDTDEFEEVKARLLSYATPVLRKHAAADDNKGPVLRRTASDSDVEILPDAGTPSKLAGVAATLTTASGYKLQQ
jgi:predicted Zn-dependent protease